MTTTQEQEAIDREAVTLRIPEIFHETARDWAGGLDSMLRAIESNGFKLALGNRRPAGADTFPKWAYLLRVYLANELSHCRRMAAGREAAKLRAFEKWAETEAATFAEAHALTDWEPEDL